MFSLQAVQALCTYILLNCAENVLSSLFSFDSASHVVILLAKKYPNIKIVNFDRLDCKLLLRIYNQVIIFHV